MNMKLMKPIAALFLAAVLLVACQTFNSVQYHVPAQQEDQLVSRLSNLATEHGMTNRTAHSSVSNTLVYFKVGDRSFTDLGARKKDDGIIVDLYFRSAGIGGKEFRQLKPEVETILRDLYGKQFKTIRDRAKQIPINED